MILVGSLRVAQVSLVTQEKSLKALLPDTERTPEGFIVGEQRSKIHFGTVIGTN
jgi:hypothetical protein